MNRFRPIFQYTIEENIKNVYEKRFNVCYLKNKAYFDSFQCPVDVYFNENSNFIITMIGDFSEEENKSHMKKIKSLIDEIMQDKLSHDL
ncbi:MAG: hypothetical protein ACO3E1_06860 [Flavobacteriales bacterium]